MRAFVTGAGSGFGRAFARRLLAAGHHVVATDVTDEHLPSAVGEGLDAAARARLTCLPLDLRDPGLVEHAAARALEAGPVDLLVNNAGYAVFGALDETDLDAVSAMFDANVVGTARVTRALLPALRASRGAVIQISSVAGRMVFPESGFYAATKFALEAMSEALYVENAEVGLQVVVVEPGAFDTGFGARASRASGPRPEPSRHGAAHAVWDRRKQAALEPPQDPERVVSAALAALDDPRGFVRVRVGDDCQRMLALRDSLGDDDWVRFFGARHGATRSGDPLATAAEVLGAEVAALEAPSGALGALAAAWRVGLVEHWLEQPGVEAAEARLRSAWGPPGGGA